ncbi:Receptor-like cytosolic serine/threonine-protein kinase RBK2, partial [Cucurbita argyrosperma subsp. sororia]
MPTTTLLSLSLKTPERTLQRLKMLLQVSTAKKLDQQDSADMVESNPSVLQTGSNDSGDIACQDQSKDQTDQAVGTPKLGSRRQRGFSDSFASHELRLLELEDEAKDESSPRGVLEDCLRSLDSETTTSRDSTSDWVVNPDSRNPSHWKGFFRLLKKGPQMRFQTFPPLAVPKIAKRKSKRIREDMLPAVSPVRDSSIQSEFCYFKSSWKNFTLSELEAASNNFNPENLIGEGGYSEVYKGQLEDGQLVAIKRLNRGTQEEMTADFLSELGIIVHVDHPNVASISDFGLAKWLPDQWTHHTVSKFEGTFGYLPPEFFMHGIVDEKTDVYAYGVLLLELITGRQALNSSQQSLVMWAKPLLPKDNLKDLVDPCLLDVFDTEQMKLMTSVASMCINQSSIQRPEMCEIVEILKGNGAALELLRRQKSIFQRTYSEELLDAEEYNSTKYLSDMDRHLEIVLGACDIDV